MTSNSSRPTGSDLGPPAAASSGIGRRGFLARASKLGATAVGAIAATWADAPNALAAPYCCDLVHPNGPFCGGHRGTGTFSCRSGYHRRVWYCAYGSVTVGCYECAAGGDCWHGPWTCSNYVYLPH